jgi:hypothetical protein
MPTLPGTYKVFKKSIKEEGLKWMSHQVSRQKELDFGPSSLGWMGSICPCRFCGTEVAMNLINGLFLSFLHLESCLRWALCRPWCLALSQRTQWQLRCDCCVNDWLELALGCIFPGTSCERIINSGPRGNLSLLSSRRWQRPSLSPSILGD